MPASVQEAVDAARAGALCETLAITVRRVAGERYDRVVGYKLGPKPINGCDSDGTVLTEKSPSEEPFMSARDYIPVGTELLGEPALACPVCGRGVCPSRRGIECRSPGTAKGRVVIER